MKLVLGIGASAGADLGEIEALIARALAAQGLSPVDVRLVASLDSKRQALAALCERHGWALVTHPAERLRQQVVPNPSTRAQHVVGTWSVAEAAAQLHGDLLVTKTTSAHATVAVARLPADTYQGG